MAIDWNVLEKTVIEEGKDFLVVVKPYLPALKRSGTAVFTDFVKHLTNKNFDEIDKLMYKSMSKVERAALEKSVLDDAYQAAMDNVAERKMTKEIGFKIALSILTKVL